MDGHEKVSHHRYFLQGPVGVFGYHSGYSLFGLLFGFGTMNYKVLIIVSLCSNRHDVGFVALFCGMGHEKLDSCNWKPAIATFSIDLSI